LREQHQPYEIVEAIISFDIFEGDGGLRPK